MNRSRSRAFIAGALASSFAGCSTIGTSLPHTGEGVSTSSASSGGSRTSSSTVGASGIVGSQGVDVTVPGSSIAGLQANIHEALSLGKRPRYVLVTTLKKSYVFPTVAKVVRTDKRLLVRSYNKLYSFTLAVKISYGSVRRVTVDEIPHVNAPGLERQISTAENVLGAKPTACTDCATILGGELPTSPLERAWAYTLDPWQAHSDAVAWAPSKSETVGGKDKTHRTRFAASATSAHERSVRDYGGGDSDYYGFFYSGGDGGGDGGDQGFGPCEFSTADVCVSVPPPTPPTDGGSGGDTGGGDLGGVAVAPPADNGGGGSSSAPSGPGCGGSPASARDGAAGNAFKAIGINDPSMNVDATVPSNPEDYGFIYSDGTNTRYDGPYTTALDGAGTASVSANSYPGWSVVGFYHTHGDYGSGNGIGDNGSHFSPFDINTGNNTNGGITIYVAEKVTVNGSADYRWYSRQPHAKSDDPGFGKFVGSGGC